MSIRKTDVLTSGYVSMDHIIRIASPARIGFTSLVENQSNVNINYGGCSVNIAYALCRIGMHYQSFVLVRTLSPMGSSSS